MESVSNAVFILSSWYSSVTIPTLAGIFQMILSCPENILLPYFAEIVDCIEWLIELQDDEGNWPTKAGNSPPTNNILVQCVGSVSNSAR